MPNDFANRVVLLTGGTGALGVGIAQLLLDRGAIVHLTSSSADGASRLSFAARVTNHAVDMSDDASVSKLFSRLPSLWASIHVAGGFSMSPIEATHADDFRRMMNQNALTAFLCCREAVKKMRSAGSGRIVNVAARAAVAPVGGMVAYSASKAAVASITQGLAEEVKSAGILVNAVLPSLMDTPANRAAMPMADHATWPKVEEVAEAIAFLASPSNTLTSGALVPVYGRA